MYEFILKTTFVTLTRFVDFFESLCRSRNKSTWLTRAMAYVSVVSFVDIIITYVIFGKHETLATTIITVYSAIHNVRPTGYWMLYCLKIICKWRRNDQAITGGRKSCGKNDNCNINNVIITIATTLITRIRMQIRVVQLARTLVYSPEA